MKKALSLFSYLVIALFVLSLFGWMTYHISKGDKNFGFLSGPVKFMYTFPDIFSQSVEEVKTLPGTFIKTPENFKPINKLDFDVNVLTFYSDTGNKRSCVLMNLRNDSIIYKWKVKNPYSETSRIWNPLLLPKKNLIYAFESAKGLYRIDSLSNLVWQQDSIKPHHSMNFDSNGDIWICSFAPTYQATGYYKLNGKSVYYINNYITKIDTETGRILFHKSITEILKDHNLENFVLKIGTRDPFHINDVEPALKSTKYYNKDDLFISSRNLSLILHYRPSTNEIVNIIDGPFASQHDVDFLGNDKLVVFNNNFYITNSTDSKAKPKDSSMLEFAGDFYSNIVQYNFNDKSFSYIGDSVFRANKIHTKTEGLVEFLKPNTYFVEEQNSGLLWIIEDDEIIYKNVLKSQHEGYHHLPNWIRIINNYETNM